MPGCFYLGVITLRNQSRQYFCIGKFKDFILTYECWVWEYGLAFSIYLSFLGNVMLTYILVRT